MTLHCHVCCLNCKSDGDQRASSLIQCDLVGSIYPPLSSRPYSLHPHLTILDDLNALCFHHWCVVETICGISLKFFWSGSDTSSRTQVQIKCAR